MSVFDLYLASRHKVNDAPGGVSMPNTQGESGLQVMPVDHGLGRGRNCSVGKCHKSVLERGEKETDK